MANSLVDCLAALELQTNSVKTPQSLRRSRVRKEEPSPSQGARKRRDERRAAATAERAELRRNSGENVWWKTGAVAGVAQPVVEVVEVEVVEEKEETPMLARAAVKDALKGLRGKLRKQWAVAVWQVAKIHGKETNASMAKRRGSSRPPTPYVPLQPSKAVGSFAAPIPSKAFDDKDLDPWAFQHDLQQPDSARRNSTDAYRIMAADADEARETARSPTTPNGAVRLTQFRLGLGPYATARTPEEQTYNPSGYSGCCPRCDHAWNEMCISPNDNTVQAVTREYANGLMAIGAEASQFGSPMDLD